MESEDELKLKKDLKKLLVSEIDLIRNSFTVLSFFFEGIGKSVFQILKDLNKESKD